jgi:glycosyltransferase involved in cell wall biosynthesis
MKVLIYHPVRLPVLQYGGTERVLLWLAKSLQHLGHQVSVFAAPGSSLSNGIDCITDPEVLLKKANGFDIIHGFTRFDPRIEEAVDGRVLFTVHGNGQKGERFHPNTVFLSRDHAKRHGATAFVYNGLDPNELKFSDGPRADRFLFLSKTSWKVKNLKGAVHYANTHKQNLWIAGGERPYSLRAFTALKRMFGADWSWKGSVDQEEKAKFLISGKAMLFPLLWNEPFGLVMVESLMSGTPVLAHPYGSVPEILEFAPQCLMKSDEDWKSAMTGERELPNARLCRDWACSKFDQITMAKKYVELYEQVASGKKLHAYEPVTKVEAREI